MAHSAHRHSLSLSSFLVFGFFIDAEPEVELDLSGAQPGRLREVGDTERFDLCAEHLRRAVRAGFDAGREHVVPISGGLDSRAVLALLLEGAEASRIHTCTFGTPGTWDYELGNRIARDLGTRHVAWPLTEHRYRHEELLETSRAIRHQTVLFHHPPLLEMREHFGDAVVWSGFLGDKLVKASTNSGGDGPRERFLEKNRYVRSTRLAPLPDTRLLDALVVPDARQTPLGLDEDLNFEFRQRRFIAPHVLPLGFEYRTPFTDPAVIGFFLSLPREERVGSRFYMRFLAATFPKLFEVGVKNFEGLPLGAAAWRATARKLRRKLVQKVPMLRDRLQDPMLNYLDFDRAFRERNDLQKITEECLQQLAGRDLLDIDPVALWRRHQRGEGDHADALIVLVSLEIHLEAGLALGTEGVACSS